MVSTVYKTRYYTATGYLKPVHTAGTVGVTLKCYRYESGKYVLRYSYNAKLTNYSWYSKYTGSVRLPLAGTWRIYAYHSDGSHAATTSSYKTVISK
jgi:hypothetical protein